MYDAAKLEFNLKLTFYLNLLIPNICSATCLSKVFKPKVRAWGYFSALNMLAFNPDML